MDRRMASFHATQSKGGGLGEDHDASLYARRCDERIKLDAVN